MPSPANPKARRTWPGHSHTRVFGSPKRPEEELQPRPALGGFRRGAHAPPCPLPFRGDDAAPENAGCDVLSGGDRRGCARREATQKILVSVAEPGAVSESIKRRHYSEDAA